MQFIRNFAKKYNDTSLIVRILIGLALGTVLALLVPDTGWIGIFGSLSAVAKTSSPGKSPWLPAALPKASRIIWSWATWILSGTGATPRITSRACG